ncbi:MAG: FtsQ-type POTRA domain-containing protein [Acidobacteriota bacterium]|nr:MAG: FtsQ-type POTRA domain-containing protein [Acidobacteriota bacterium]
MVARHDSFTRQHRLVSATKERWMRKAWRILRRSMGALAVLFLFGTAAAAAWRGLTTLEFFFIERVEFASGERTPASDFKSIASQALGKNLFLLPLEELRAEALKHPWAREVVIYRALPNRLRIAIEEPVPTALVEQDGTMVWVDAEGNFIEAVAANELVHGVDVPLLVGCGSGETQKGRLRRGASALDELRRNFPAFYQRLASLDVSHGTYLVVHLKDYGGPFWFHSEDVLRNVANLEAVWGVLSRRHPAPAYVDLRWRNQIVVMPTAADKPGQRPDKPWEAQTKNAASPRLKIM